jgi:membrane complex biogenesis BtpA family protein
MVHLDALPGAPLFGGSLDAVIDSALRDARAIREGGAAGLIVENFGDRPFFATQVPPETVAAMTRVISEIAREVRLPLGVNVLRNDARSALAVAAATGASFIRVNVHTGAMLTDQGIIEGAAAETLRARAALGAGIAIFADHLVKHAAPIAETDPLQVAKDVRLRGLADALIVTGSETGAAADPSILTLLRDALDVPLVIGSGLTPENASRYLLADAAIVGTSLKRAGKVDSDLVRAVVAAFSSQT